MSVFSILSPDAYQRLESLSRNWPTRNVDCENAQHSARENSIHQLSSVPAKEEDREGVLGWEPQFKATLEQQMKKMADAIRCSEPNAKADLRNAYHTDELANFAKQFLLK